MHSVEAVNTKYGTGWDMKVMRAKVNQKCRDSNRGGLSFVFS